MNELVKRLRIIEDMPQANETVWMDTSLLREIIATLANVTAPASGVKAGMMRAPWPDFLGQPIYHGDRMSHPDGNEFIAIRLGTDDDSWRAVYGEDGAISRLSLQVGDKGQAFVVTRAADQVNAEGGNNGKV